MGPNIILDKSAFQCLSESDTHELSRYFSVVVPPVLILEILADLKKDGAVVAEARVAVQRLAWKLQQLVDVVNVDFRELCIRDLLGGSIPVDRGAVVAGGRRVTAANGSVGAFLDTQPENAALFRWSCGMFDEAEELLGAQWRKASEALDLDGFKRHLRDQVDWVPLHSMTKVANVVDELMRSEKAQLTLIRGLLSELRTIPEVEEWTLHRWRNGGFHIFEDFARYAQHCSRVNALFQLALVHHVVGTRSTNRIDLEYMYYAPFAHVFCSGDKFHRTIAEAVLCADQSFVWHDDLRTALREVADARREAQASGSGNGFQLAPQENSLIRTLWMKHLGHWMNWPVGGETTIPEKKQQEMLARVQAIVDAAHRARGDLPPRPKWPCP